MSDHSTPECVKHHARTTMNTQTLFPIERFSSSLFMLDSSSCWAIPLHLTSWWTCPFSSPPGREGRHLPTVAPVARVRTRDVPTRGSRMCSGCSRRWRTRRLDMETWGSQDVTGEVGSNVEYYRIPYRSSLTPVDHWSRSVGDVLVELVP